MGGGAFCVVGRAVAALGSRLLRRGGDEGFQFGVDAHANDAPAFGLDARPLVQRGAVHGRVVRQLGRLHDAAPRPLLRVEAGVERRATSRPRCVAVSTVKGWPCGPVASCSSISPACFICVTIRRVV